MPEHPAPLNPSARSSQETIVQPGFNPSLLLSSGYSNGHPHLQTTSESDHSSDTAAVKFNAPESRCSSRTASIVNIPHVVELKGEVRLSFIRLLLAHVGCALSRSSGSGRLNADDALVLLHRAALALFLATTDAVRSLMPIDFSSRALT